MANVFVQELEHMAATLRNVEKCDDIIAVPSAVADATIAVKQYTDA